MLLELVVNHAISAAKISLIIDLPTSTSHDMIYVDLASRLYKEKYLTVLSEKEVQLCPKHHADYYLLEET
jgi:hypothetical protein